MSEQAANVPMERLLRELTPQVLGTLARKFRDFAAAEDAFQEASLAAALQWPRDGAPENPRAWLTQVAFNRMTDHLRGESARRLRQTKSALPEAVISRSSDSEIPEGQDDALSLLFMCCHPSLTPASAIALTLRAVGGLTTDQIARAFLVPESTMAQRISRAKQSIMSSGIRFQPPTEVERTERLGAVLHILYLIFNEGYTTSVGEGLRRDDLALEAIRITRILHELLPEKTEVAGLLALMLLTDARRHARTGAEGELIPLSRQNRTLWDRERIAEGVALLSAVLPKGEVGPYQLQAAIAAVHDEAERPDQTDWPQILALYDLLKRISDNPMVALNHAVAAAMVQGPVKGRQLLDAAASDARLADHYRRDAVQAHLLELAGDHEGAINHYLKAAGKTASGPERDYLLAQSARLARDADP